MSTRCPGPEAWLAFYGGELKGASEEALAEHLQGCPRCREEFDRLCRLGAQVAGAFSVLPQAPPARAASTRRFRVRRWRTLGLPFAAAAALGVVAVGIVMLSRDSGDAKGPVAERPPATSQESQTAEVPEVGPAQPRVGPPVPSPEPKAPPPPVTAPPREEKRPTPPVSPPRPKVPARVPDPPDRPVPRTTVTAIAILDRIEGEVFVLHGSGAAPVPARDGTPLLPGQGLRTGGFGSVAIVTFPDRTRLEVGADTTLSGFSEGSGKRVALAAGSLRAEVATQPQGRPMVFTAPQGEVKVLGTTLRLVAEPGGKGSTRLEVKEGKVLLKRSLDGKMVEVMSGHYAVAAPGVELVAKPLDQSVLVSFDFELGRRPVPWTKGVVEKGPPRPGNGFCLVSSAKHAGTETIEVHTDTRIRLCTFTQDVVLKFDYWVSPEVGGISVRAYNRTQGQHFSLGMGQVSRGNWNRAALRFDDFRPEADPNSPWSPGDVISQIIIGIGEGTLCVDNVAVVEDFGDPARRSSGRRR